MEPEETQDYVRDAMDLSQQEAEERNFVPSTISVPQKPWFWCDNRCSETTLSFRQFASVVVEDGEEFYKTNLCQQCNNKHLGGRRKGEKPLTKWQWNEFVEKKAHRGRLWRMFGEDQYIREMWEYVAEKEQELKGCERRPKKKDKQEYKASGSMNRQPGSSWSK